MIPCPSCSRFVRTNVSHCPFCGSGVHTVPSPLAKAAMGAMLGITLSACGGQESNDDGVAEGGTTTFMETAVAAYGGPDVDTNFEDTMEPPDQTTDDGGSSTGMVDTGSSSGSETESSSTGGSGTGGSGTGDSGTDGSGGTSTG